MQAAQRNPLVTLALGNLGGPPCLVVQRHCHGVAALLYGLAAADAVLDQGDR
ncbi:hypothetical protein D9M68_937880 [compost metagenome]